MQHPALRTAISGCSIRLPCCPRSLRASSKAEAIAGINRRSHVSPLECSPRARDCVPDDDGGRGQDPAQKFSSPCSHA